MQASRYELKYLIDETQARYVRQLIRGMVEPDENMDPSAPWGYSVRSLYLDHPSLQLCRQTICGHKNRFKLRVRFYDDSQDTPAFFEIKQRVDQVIRKQRALVRREAVPWLMSGGGPRPGDLFDGSKKSADALRNFCKLRDHAGALPQVYVVYTREAYMSPDNDDLRITFDRQLLAYRYQPAEGLKLPRYAAQVPMGGVVLELKYTNTFPLWMKDMVQQLRLKRTSFPKYVYCLRTLRVPSADNTPTPNRLGAAI